MSYDCSNVALTAKEELHAQAVALHREGWAVPAIAQRLGVAKSTAYLSVRHVPLDRHRGCLAAEVPRSSRIYWWIEGIMRGMAGEGSLVGR